MKKTLFYSLIYIFISCRDVSKHNDGVVVIKENIINLKLDTQFHFLTFGDFYMDMPENDYNKIIISKASYLNDYLKRPGSKKKPLFLWGLDSGNNKILSFIPMIEMDTLKRLHSYSMIFSTLDNITFLGTKNNDSGSRYKLKELLKSIVVKNIKTEPNLHNGNYVWCFANCYLVIKEGIVDIVSIDIISDKKNEYCHYIQNGRNKKDPLYYLDSLMKLSKKNLNN